MRSFLAFVAMVLVVSTAGVALAKVNPGAPSLLNVTQAPKAGWQENDIPARTAGAAKVDTVVFGYYTTKIDGNKYAVLNQEWTWDHGAADNLEGWTSVDQTNNDMVYWRQLTQAKWLAEGATIAWPQITGNGMALCGATKGHADSLAWLNGIGYGNDWCQRLTSPTLTYDGTGTVDLTLNYFSESELDFDYTRLFVESGSSRIQINSPGFNGKIGIDTLGVITPVNYLKTISNLDFGGGTDSKPFHLVVEFDSDGNLSDEDGGDGGDSFYGGFGVDDVQFDGANLIPPTGVFYGFETDLQGWTASKCPGVGSYFGLANMSQYIVTDPCTCSLQNNVLEMHNASRLHPIGQHEMLFTPIVDRENDIPGGTYLQYNRIIAEWDQYADLPEINGVFYRAGWSYYPYENPNVPGLIQWSPRIGIDTFYFAGDTPSCSFNRSIGTDWGLPSDAKRVKFIYEIFGSCEAFGVDPCSGITNFTPLVDNVTVRNVGYVGAPVAQYDTGTRFQDGFGQSSLGVLSTTDPGNSDIVADLRRSTPAPTLLGDSLMIIGPTPTTAPTKWEAKLWFRLKRMGPGQNAAGNPGLAAFNSWKNTVTANKGDFFTGAQPNFAWGYMDSVELPTPQRAQFCSQFREAVPQVGLQPEPCFNWGGGTGDQGPGNEILPDGMFTPGTKIEYFITTNYLGTPTAYYIFPDTIGRFYSEFEILPSFRNVSGTDKFPCVLYVDAFNNGAQFYIENALNVVLNGAGSGAPIPDPTSWDRYDYMDASSNWNGPLYRVTGGTSGATIPQLLGYKLIMVSLGNASQGSMEPRDWQGFQQWMDAVVCTGNAALQGFIVDGTSAAEIINGDYPYLLNNTLGATYTCRTYNEYGCAPAENLIENDQQNCVRVSPSVGSPFGAGIATDVSGNWCPLKIPFNVLGTTGTGFGNKKYEKINSGYLTSFAQVINDKMGAGGSNYRSIIESFSYHYLAARDMANPGLAECIYTTDAADSAARVTAAYKEIENSIKWALNISNPQAQVGLCINPCGNPLDPASDVGEGAAGTLVTRLYQNHPNPFNPRTAIKFSLATDGPAKLIIYDVNGRQVRTLVDKGLQAGTHEVIWDGTDNAGHTVTSGVYWSQLQAGAYSSNKKMVVLK